jgi:hypothetical protein
MRSRISAAVGLNKRASVSGDSISLALVAITIVFIPLSIDSAAVNRESSKAIG